MKTLEFRPADLQPALSLLFEKATIPIQKWPARDELDRLVASVNSDLDAPSERASRAFWRALFGYHSLARAVSTSDLPRVTRSDVESWIGRVYNVRNAVLIVVGDIDPDEVAEYGLALSRKVNTPSWVGELPVPAPPVLRPPTAEHLTTVVTARPGSLIEVRFGCLLPRMTEAERAEYETFRLTIQVAARHCSPVRPRRGVRSGGVLRLVAGRNDLTSSIACTFLDADDFSRTRWPRSIVMAALVARGLSILVRRMFGRLALRRRAVPRLSAAAHVIAYDLFNDWNAGDSRAALDTSPR